MEVERNVMNYVAGRALSKSCIGNLYARSMSTMGSVFPAKFERLVRFVDNNGTERTGELLIGQEEHKAKEYSTGDVHTVAKFLPPINPPNILCVGLNYASHAQEVSMQKPLYPVLFSKSSGCIVGHREPIRLPSVATDECDYEAELAVVIGRPCKNASKENALSYVIGYTAANDVSARKWQGKKGGGQWVRGKSFDTFGPLGPVLVSSSIITDPQQLKIELRVNGEVRQSGHTSNMLFSVPELIAFLSQDTTLLPGTVILTGTPAGVGYTRTPPSFLRPGDELEVRIDKIGSLRNSVLGPEK